MAYNIRFSLYTQRGKYDPYFMKLWKYLAVVAYAWGFRTRRQSQKLGKCQVTSWLTNLSTVLMRCTIFEIFTIENSRFHLCASCFYLLHLLHFFSNFTMSRTYRAYLKTYWYSNQAGLTLVGGVLKGDWGLALVACRIIGVINALMIATKNESTTG